MQQMASEQASENHFAAVMQHSACWLCVFLKKITYKRLLNF